MCNFFFLLLWAAGFNFTGTVPCLPFSVMHLDASCNAVLNFHPPPGYDKLDVVYYTGSLINSHHFGLYWRIWRQTDTGSLSRILKMCCAVTTTVPTMVKEPLRRKKFTAMPKKCSVFHIKKESSPATSRVARKIKSSSHYCLLGIAQIECVADCRGWMYIDWLCMKTKQALLLRKRVNRESPPTVRQRMKESRCQEPAGTDTVIDALPSPHHLSLSSNSCFQAQKLTSCSKLCNPWIPWFLCRCLPHSLFMCHWISFSLAFSHISTYSLTHA